MIEIKNLTKIFTSKKKKYQIFALDDVSLTLPDKGMVFIVGKSGSGKSTLLNMIGALDSPTKGTIIADGNEVTSFNLHKANDYRSSYVGFVFQDYHLLNELNVEQNIKFFISKKDNVSKDEIDNILTKVGLEGLNKRYPSELSGGQRQRVAIGRSIIKNPEVLLCDEPTGNLDKETSTNILNLLKEISLTKLVVIVSHNLADAAYYGDRIITLSDGKIIADKEKIEGYNNELRIEENRLILPHNYTLTEDDLKLINEKITNGEFSEIKQNNEGYVKSKKTVQENTTRNLTKGRISKRNILKLFLSFLNTKKIPSIVNCVMTMFLFVAFSILQSFLSFSPTTTTIEKIKNGGTNIVSLKKENAIDKRIFVGHATEKELATFDKVADGYEKAIYYNYTFGTNINEQLRHGIGLNPYEGYVDTNPFITETEGLINCSIDWLTQVYGKEDKLNYVGDINRSINEGEIIITDYIADSIIFNRKLFNTTYEDLLGPLQYKNSSYLYKANVCAIIETGYKEKYKELFDAFLNYTQKPTYETSQAFTKVKESELFIDFFNELSTTLAFSYSLSNDFLASTQTLVNRNYAYIGSLHLSLDTSGSEQDLWSSQFTAIYSEDKSKYDLKPGEIVITASAYNILFGENVYDSSNYNVYDGQTHLTIRRYEDNDELRGKLLYEKTFRIAALIPQGNEGFMNIEDIKEISRWIYRPFAVSYVGLDDQTLNSVLTTSERMNYLPIQAEAAAAISCSRAVNMFGDTFTILSIMLVAFGTIFIVSYGINSIFSNRYQIGVIKALGGSTTDIGKIFILKVVTISLLAIIMSIIGSIYMLPFADSILVSTFETITNREAFKLVVIAVKPELLIINSLVVFGLYVISALIALLTLRKIKPANIIKARE